MNPKTEELICKYCLKKIKQNKNKTKIFCSQLCSNKFNRKVKKCPVCKSNEIYKFTKRCKSCNSKGPHARGNRWWRTNYKPRKAKIKEVKA